jgi:hypothetical protein
MSKNNNQKGNGGYKEPPIGTDYISPSKLPPPKTK